MRHLVALQAVVFDLDGTLLDRRLSFERFMCGQWTRFSRFLKAVDQAEYVRTVIELDCDGYAPRKELFAGTLARFSLPSELAETLLRDYRARFPGACVLFPDATQTLSSLRAAGLRLGLITNGSVRMQSSKLKCLALVPAFDTVLISDAEGVSKPDPEIFRRALERLSTRPEHAVFVGDHPEVDVSGARGAGMKAIWRRDRGLSRAVEADAIIDELGDLPSLLGLEAVSPGCREVTIDQTRARVPRMRRVVGILVLVVVGFGAVWCVDGCADPIARPNTPLQSTIAA